MVFRLQLSKTNVRVVEIIPPLVETELQQGRPLPIPPMPIPVYMEQTVKLLEQDADEVPVGPGVANLEKLNAIQQPVMKAMHGVFFKSQ